MERISAELELYPPLYDDNHNMIMENKEEWLRIRDINMEKLSNRSRNEKV